MGKEHLMGRPAQGTYLNGPFFPLLTPLPNLPLAQWVFGDLAAKGPGSLSESFLLVSGLSQSPHW